MFSLTGAYFLKFDFWYLEFSYLSVWMTMVPRSGSYSSLCLHPKLLKFSCHSLIIAQYFHLPSQSEFLSHWNYCSKSILLKHLFCTIIFLPSFSIWKWYPSNLPADASFTATLLHFSKFWFPAFCIVWNAWGPPSLLGIF